MISLQYNQASTAFTTTFSDSTFSNINFVRGGNLIEIFQQSDIQVNLRNITFTNITGGVISVESFTQTTLTETSAVVLSSITAIELNQEYQHFIEAKKAGIIKVLNSSFTAISGYFQGSVAYVQDRGSLIDFYDSTFRNNTSLKAALFDVENVGTLKCTNCTISNNFAVESAIFYTFGDGKFILSDSIIEDNFSMNIKVGEILDSASESIINN